MQEALRVTYSHIGCHRKFLDVLRFTGLHLEILSHPESPGCNRKILEAHRVKHSHLRCQRKLLEALIVT